MLDRNITNNTAKRKKSRFSTFFLDNAVNLLIFVASWYNDYTYSLEKSHLKLDNMLLSFDIQRFVKAQDSQDSYKTALEEVRNGRKRSHWIWFVFPQVAGLGVSGTSKLYAIRSLSEAKAYWDNEILRSRLVEITSALLEQNVSAQIIFGGLDAMKVCSCMTLFDLVVPNDIFAKVLDKFYNGQKCYRTLSILKYDIASFSQRTKEQPLIEKKSQEIVHPMYTPERIGSLKDGEIFVFGSNLSGMHLGGAARAAHLYFGAIMGQGVGLQGQSYAIPTMQGGIETIEPYVDDFIRFAEEHSELFFYVTRIGCGIAGFKDEEIAPLFENAVRLNNVCLPKSFVDVLRCKCNH